MSAPPQQKEPVHYSFTLDSILGDIEKYGQLTSVTRSLMTMKLAEISRQNQVGGDQRKLNE